MKTLLAVALLSTLASASFAQESGLPPECGTPHDMGGTTDMAMTPVDEAHAALAAGMGKMHADMDAGIMAEDIDVAFVCGMIPHHQGAIDMARAVIQYGDDPWTKELAQNIITAQEDEIAQMKDGVRLINFARGGIIDEIALANAVRSGKVAGVIVAQDGRKGPQDKLTLPPKSLSK